MFLKINESRRELRMTYIDRGSNYQWFHKSFTSDNRLMVYIQATGKSIAIDKIHKGKKDEVKFDNSSKMNRWEDSPTRSNSWG